MADLEPLVRMRKHVVEQKQKFLAELYRHAEELTNQKDTLLKQMDEEQEKAKDFGVEMLSYLGAYSQNVKERVADIDEAMTQLEARIEVARDDMRDAYAELKKVEITQERREDEEDRARDKKESDMLDEIALEGYRRKQAEE